MSSDNILDRWAELERAATGGPWVQTEIIPGCPPAGANIVGDGWVVAGLDTRSTGEPHHDAALIVFLRNHSAELREVVEAAIDASRYHRPRTGPKRHALHAALERLGVR